MHVPHSSPSVANPFSIAVAKMQLDGQSAQGEAANQLIDAAGEVVEDAVREQGVGRRVDVDA